MPRPRIITPSQLDDPLVSEKIGEPFNDDPTVRQRTSGQKDQAAEVNLKGAFTFVLVGTISTGTNAAPALIATTDLTIDEIYAYIRTAPTGQALTLDINKNGSSILSSTLSISAGANTGTATPTTTTLVKNDRLDIDIDQVGSTVAGSDLTVHVRVTQ